MEHSEKGKRVESKPAGKSRQVRVQTKEKGGAKGHASKPRGGKTNRPVIDPGKVEDEVQEKTAAAVPKKPVVVRSDAGELSDPTVARYRPHNGDTSWKGDEDTRNSMDAALARVRAGHKIAIVVPTIAMNARYIERMSKETGLDLRGRKITYQGNASLDDKAKALARSVNLVLTAPLKPAAVKDLQTLGYELYTATVSSKYIANATIAGENAAARRSNAFFERDACLAMRAQGVIVGALSATSDVMKDLYKAVQTAEEEVANHGDKESFDLGADQEDPNAEAAGTESQLESTPDEAAQTVVADDGAPADNGGLESNEQ